MKPITADTPEGRTLIALRAGQMTRGELLDRLGNAEGTRSLLRLGFIESVDGHYRITDSGRAACPYRNPLAAPGVVQPYTFKPEDHMTTITRQQVLAAIVEAGAAGITRRALLDRFECAETCIDNHIMHLNKQTPAVIIKPEKGRFMAVQFWRAPAPVAPAIEPSPKAAKQKLIDMAADIDLESLVMPAHAFETIEIKAAADRRAPAKIDVDADDLEIGIFSDGSMDMLVDDGLNDAQLKLSAAAVKKLLKFIGLFQEAA